MNCTFKNPGRHFRPGLVVKKLQTGTKPLLLFLSGIIQNPPAGPRPEVLTLLNSPFVDKSTQRGSHSLFFFTPDLPAVPGKHPMITLTPGSRLQGIGGQFPSLAGDFAFNLSFFSLRPGLNFELQSRITPIPGSRSATSSWANKPQAENHEGDRQYFFVHPWPTPKKMVCRKNLSWISGGRRKILSFDTWRFILPCQIGTGFMPRIRKGSPGEEIAIPKPETKQAGKLIA